VTENTSLGLFYFVSNSTEINEITSDEYEFG
jgi:hypothetical protein